MLIFVETCVEIEQLAKHKSHNG